ncbi:hypothetical protein IFM89_026426 [Coptis chinensis]|uniref:Uncharacterized protein n=1 Tax=Coptis chinensis TaxID=261450 RepID=A0A835HMS1_9MAGN|nr:hypothetical protein IFM89_026426 [Coptis chinensis]
MKFTVKALSNSSNGNGRARVGLLQLGNCPTPIETPSLLLSTRKALPVFIAHDLLPSLPSPDSHLLQVSPLHFLESPTPNAISSIGGLHKMVGLHKHCFVAEYMEIRPAEYMEMISSLKPNLWASLADEVPAWVGGKLALGAIVGGSSVEERIRCAQEVARRHVSVNRSSSSFIIWHCFRNDWYIYHLTLGGFALVFPLNRDERHISNSQLSDTGVTVQR